MDAVTSTSGLGIALKVCVEKGKASVAILQKELGVGFEDANIILGWMEQNGYLTPAKGNRPRYLLNLAYETVAFWNAEDELKRQNQGDELFEEALKICVEMKRASTSVIQRRLGIGYGRAAAILDMMEREGFIGQADGARPRPVLSRAYQFVNDSPNTKQEHSNDYGQTAPTTYSHLDSYKILGVEVGASREAITSAYRKMAQMYHPDKVASLAPEFKELAERKMKEINAAYTALCK